MTAKEAAEITGLATRENKGSVHNEWLRCILGEWEQVEVKVSAYRSVKEKIFRVIAFGESWEKAVGMWERSQKSDEYHKLFST